MAGRPSKSKFRIENYPLFAMAHIVAHAQNRIVNAIRHYRMPPSVWRVISMVAEVDGIKINSLARRVIVERSALSRIVAKLEDDGLLERRADPKDGRSVTLHLSQKGRKLYQDAAPLAQRELDTILSALSEKERTTLMALLGRIRRQMPTIPEWASDAD
jgi:DNA-binding MarR family transcriptional regulator